MRLDETVYGSIEKLPCDIGGIGSTLSVLLAGALIGSALTSILIYIYMRRKLREGQSSLLGYSVISNGDRKFGEETYTYILAQGENNETENENDKSGNRNNAQAQSEIIAATAAQSANATSSTANSREREDILDYYVENESINEGERIHSSPQTKCSKKENVLLREIREYLEECHGRTNSKIREEDDNNNQDSMGMFTFAFMPNKSCDSVMEFYYSFDENELQSIFGGMSDALSNHNDLQSSCGDESNSAKLRMLNYLTNPDELQSKSGDRKDSTANAKLRRPSRSSISGSFLNVDGDEIDNDENSVDTRKSQHQPEYAVGPGTKIHVTSDDRWYDNDEAVMQARKFDEQVLSKLKTVKECQQLLRRTRAVAALASRLMAAPDEQSCYDVVTRLLVPLFQVDRCSYVLMKDSEHVIVKKIAVNDRNLVVKMGLEGGKAGVVIPIKETAVAVCARTLQQHYTPYTKDSPLPAQRKLHSMGINTVLATPILVYGNKFVGCIMTAMTKEDAFKDYDQILINDIAAMLGANIYSKRMRQAAERSSAISREMLNSLIPPKVINKIECFWDKSSTQYKKRRSFDLLGSVGTSVTSSMSPPDDCPNDRRKSVTDKIDFLNSIINPDEEYDDACVIVDTTELTSTSSALYAETVQNVCILFLDVVDFSRISLELEPIQVMDMLQDCFSRFDALCDKHGVLKLETIGDAFICATNLFDDNDDDEDFIDDGNKLKNAALIALAIAKDMIIEARKVMIPSKNAIETLQVRVGIHIGEVTCGVLGERLPKFTVFGSAVNLAARMEQTSLPSKIRVTKDFHDLVSDIETDWEEHNVISVKNMGEIDTYLFNPLMRDFDLDELDMLSFCSVNR